MATKPKSNKGKKQTKKKPTPKKKPLSELQLNFCREYVKDFNAKQSYIRAGYKTRGKSAEVNASRLLSDARVKLEIEKLKQKLLKKQEITAEKVLKEISKMAFDDISNYLKIESRKIVYGYDDDLDTELSGIVNTIMLKDLTDVDTRNISEVYTDAKGNLRLKLHSKEKGLEMLGKYFGMFQEKVQVTGEVNANVNHKMNLSNLSTSELETMLKLIDKAKDDESTE